VRSNGQIRPMVLAGSVAPKHLPAGDSGRHSAPVRCHLVLAVFMTLGCGSEALTLPKRPALRVLGTLPVPPRPTGTVYRDEVVGAVQTGLGYFLQRVDLRAVTQPDDSGRRTFVGFEVLAMRPAREWLAFDFVPGDIVTSFEGVSVEHYDSVIPLFEALVSKARFEISLIRGGQPKTVVVTIAERPVSK